MADKDITIAIQTTADTSGASQAEEAIKKVDKAAEDAETHASLQQQRDARTKGTTSSLASEVTATQDLAELEARRAAARLSNEAAMAEAQTIRIAKAQAAAEAQRAADLAEVLAAREKLALEEAQAVVANERRLGTLTRRAAMMAGGSERAVMAVDEAAMALTGSSISLTVARAAAAGLAGPWGLVAAAVGAGAIALNQASAAADELSVAAKAAGLNTEALDRAAHPIKTVMDDAWQGTKTLGHGLLNVLTLGTLNATEATIKETKAHVEQAAKMEASLKKAKELDEEMKRRGAQSIRKMVDDENQALAEQERQMNRLVSLKDKLNGQATTGARQEVEWAKLQGGDVALAEANALAAEMRAGLDQLNGDLAKAQQAYATASQTASKTQANVTYQQGLLGPRNAKNEAAWARLDAENEKAEAASNTALQNLQDQTAAFDGAQKNILRGTEIEMAKKTQEWSGQNSQLSEKAMNRLYGELKAELAKTPPQAQEAIAKIQTDTAAIVTAATTKATEVQTGIQTASTGTDAAIGGIASTVATTATATATAVNAASTQVTEALSLMSEQFLTALGKISANVLANANKIQAQQNQINQLFARIR